MLAVVAMPEEIDLLAEEHKKRIIVTGVGAVNIINALKDVDKKTAIVNVGYAGSNCLPIGSRVKIGKSKLYHPNVAIQEKEYDLKGDVTCYTSNDFVLKTDMEQPCVFDMELVFIMALGFENVISEKVVSDNLSVEKFNEYRNQQKGCLGSAMGESI